MEDLIISPEDKEAIENYCRKKILAPLWSFEVDVKKNTLTIKPNQTEGGALGWEFRFFINNYSKLLNIERSKKSLWINKSWLFMLALSQGSLRK